MSEITAVVLGAGLRGLTAYSTYGKAFPGEIKFVAVAEPRQDQRKAFAAMHHLPEAMCFTDWRDLMAGEKLADAVFICTQDDDHYELTLQALAKGYHVLLEKPMSNNMQECIDIVRASEQYGRVLSVCHVLRYSPFFRKVKEVVQSGALGEIATVELSENVATWHQSHSFVRGNWRNSDIASPMILAKSCHDMDILAWLIDRDCDKVSSFGSLMHFKKECAPEGAPLRCLDGCPAQRSCPYYAPKIYIEWTGAWQANAIREAVSLDSSPEAVLEALRTGPYGRCVYHCDNNVVDHQVVNMEFAGGVTASFTMTAFTYEERRKLHIFGTKGELTAISDKNHIAYADFLTGTRQTIQLNVSDYGHGGGDHAIVRDFIRNVAAGDANSLSSARRSLQSHLMSFGAEQSRVTGKVVSIQDLLSSSK